MSPNVLEETLRVEQEVQARIAAEQKRAELWRDERKTALAQKISAEQHEVCAREEQAEERLRRDFAEKAGAHLHQAEERAVFLETIDDSILKPLIRTALLTTLPGFEP